MSKRDTVLYQQIRSVTKRFIDQMLRLTLLEVGRHCDQAELVALELVLIWSIVGGRLHTAAPFEMGGLHPDSFDKRSESTTEGSLLELDHGIS